MFRPAWQQKDQSTDSFIWMSMRLADYYAENGNTEKAMYQLQQAKNIILLLKDDEIPPFWKENYYMSNGLKWIERIDRRLEGLANSAELDTFNAYDAYRRFY